MGERFYLSQLKATGSCCGINPNKRRKRMAWTDEEKDQAITMYQDANPTAENSIEIVKQIAEEMDQSPNGVRMILTKAKVYIKKAEGASGGGAKAAGDKPARVSKEDAQNGLISAIENAGGVVDEDIINKLTGKAAVYFTGLFAK